MLARVGWFVAVAMTVAITAAPGVAPPAAGEPDPDKAIGCDYTMTDPAIVDVNGTAMVMSTLAPAACPGRASPHSSRVCLSAPGNAGRCAVQNGNLPAEVYLSPYVPGTTYTAQGRGCATMTNPPQAICTTVGPRSITL